MRIAKTITGLVAATLSVVSLAAADTIEGTVSFKGSAPKRGEIKFGNDAKCAAKYKGGKKLLKEDVVVNGGKLQWVLVSVKNAPKGGKVPPKALLDQKACHYEPHVLAVMTGQPIEIKNSDGFNHNINTVAGAKKNKGWNISQPTSMSETKPGFTRTENIPVKCNVHKWMTAYIAVFDHPYFAVTGADGKYTIKGIRAGTYEVEFWHEKLGTKAVKGVKVKGTGKAEITF